MCKFINIYNSPTAFIDAHTLIGCIIIIEEDYFVFLECIMEVKSPVKTNATKTLLNYLLTSLPYDIII